MLSLRKNSLLDIGSQPEAYLVRVQSDKLVVVGDWSNNKHQEFIV